MKDLYYKKIQKRTIFLLLPFSLWFCIVVIRLIQLQVIDHAHFKSIVSNQNQNKYKVNPERGTIYDRNESILARSIQSHSIFLAPYEDEPQTPLFEKLDQIKPILKLSLNKINWIKTRIKNKDSFIWVKRKIDLRTFQAVKKLNLKGIYSQVETKRIYPKKTLAAHIIGKVDIDEVGQSGIEYKYNSILGGEKGERLALRDAKRREYRFEILKKPVPGKDLFLSIDETIQYYASRELKKAVLQNRANWGTVIISHPPSGEILAMTTYPDYDLNLPSGKIPSERNQAIHHIFDPGSTFKIITASAAIEFNKISLDQTFDCSKGFRVIAGKTFWDHRKFDILTFPEVIIHSSNVGTTLIGEMLGNEILFDSIKAFGFGEKTGIGLPAEERGIFQPLKKWTAISYASLSIGYEISVTAIQMNQAINIVANRGILIPPRIIRISPEDSLPNTSEKRRVISENTARIMTDILEDVVLYGTGTKAHIKGYSIAGKTGTAQKIDPNTKKYTSKAHMATFIGFVPADKPAISIIVVLDEPKDKFYGGEVAAPVFRNIAIPVLRYLGIKRKKENQQKLITARAGRTAQ